MHKTTLILGQTVTYEGDPFVDGPDAVRVDSAGGILMSGGKIAAVGSRDQLLSDYPDVEVDDFNDCAILPGFIDAHVHYPQTAIIASWGKRLIDWLNTYTFPEEMKFGDPEFAREISARYLDLALLNGTTTVASFCTIHPESANAFFEESLARSMRVVGGKTCMDRNAPDGLRDCAQSAYDDTKSLINKWHGVGRIEYAITPRFSPTSTREQLSALGALWAECPDCLMQTHLSEQTDEIAWVKELFPEARDYLDTYEVAGLLGERGVFGHAIHLTDREISRLAEAGSSVVHCPTSNTFIGSGLFDALNLISSGISVGLATDTGGGSSFSMLRTMAAAYEIAQLRGNVLHPSELIWLATKGSAEALKLGDKVGQLSVGYEADVTVLDLASTSAIEQRASQAEDFWEAFFPTIMMGDDRAIAAVYVDGARVNKN